MKKSTKAKMLAAIAGISFLALGCQDLDVQDAGNKSYYAVTFSVDNTKAMIIPIKNHPVLSGGMLQFYTIDGAKLITSSIDTKIYQQIDSSITVEDFTRIKAGEDVEISYLTDEYALKLN